MTSLPALEDVLASARVVSIATRTKFRSVSEREAVIFDGPARFSEFSPFLEYDDAEAANWLAAALEFAWQDLPALNLEQVEVNATVPAVRPEDVPGILARFDGCKTVKVKVAEASQTLEDDVMRLSAVRESVGDDVKVRIDANGAWSLNEARASLSELQRFDLDYAEQPVMSIDELALLRGEFAGSVKIAADESVRKASDPLAVANAGAADLLIIKAQPLGGISRARKIISSAGLPVVISSALDTSIGISMGAHLAASLAPGELYGACGLGTVALLNGDVTVNSLVPKHGAIPVTDVVADQKLLLKYAASADRTAWWHDRIRRCYELLKSAT